MLRDTLFRRACMPFWLERSTVSLASTTSESCRSREGVRRREKVWEGARRREEASRGARRWFHLPQLLRGEAERVAVLGDGGQHHYS